jgi:hypothetical protein
MVRKVLAISVRFTGMLEETKSMLPLCSCIIGEHSTTMALIIDKAFMLQNCMCGKDEWPEWSPWGCNLHPRQWVVPQDRQHGYARWITINASDVRWESEVLHSQHGFVAGFISKGHLGSVLPPWKKRSSCLRHFFFLHFCLFLNLRWYTMCAVKAQSN